ncbi:two component transcriptional regulator, LuxR family [Proteiniborus ethanoligenes]|uniref:Stage 0 sporulation protein A homolog n=1 Tax=Proteiniborus ethanoligenes TaxID=415015 RepID=A0A1H3R8B1_9FIRM|nr:response regulator transcription factor [Proteiniborus ethanoligenes]TAH63272.1 MAG: response regulator transcription factor [Gottschalkiaceae bacterium]SDZ21199.1 two component transcriptional regulator, LuxR family [Proteiniborus ethanoligenes]
MKVLIVDDDGLIRDSLKILLGLESDIEVVGIASNGQEAFDLCGRIRPDIVLMDIRMPIMDGVLGTKLIKEHFSHTKVIILTTFKDDEYIREAIKNGAEGYILKNQSSDSIVDSLRAVYRGNTVLDKEIADTLTSMIKDKPDKKNDVDYDFGNRELEILKLISEGLSNKEIGARLYLSEGTVRNYITGLLDKLNLRDRTQLAIFYLKNM